VEIMQQHVNGPRPALPTACANLEPLLDRMMARNPGGRFDNASAMHAALSSAITATLLTPSAGQLDAAVALQ